MIEAGLGWSEREPEAAESLWLAAIASGTRVARVPRFRLKSLYRAQIVL